MGKTSRSGEGVPADRDLGDAEQRDDDQVWRVGLEHVAAGVMLVAVASGQLGGRAGALPDRVVRTADCRASHGVP
jgi:hypothetical protein